MTWYRIEGLGVDPEMDEGMAARVADPLWLLARQWQVGEFRGEDAATPLIVQAELRVDPITHYWVEGTTGTRTSVPREDLGVPLETMVEQEPVGAATRDRLGIESGAALLRACRRAGVPPTFEDSLRASYPAGWSDDPNDPVGSARMALLARGSIDGLAIVEKIDELGGNAGGDPDKLPELAALPEGRRPQAAAIVGAWYEAERSLFATPDPTTPSAWNPRRQEYRFGVSSQTDRADIELEAPEYPGGTLDWHHFDVVTSKLSDRADQGLRQLRALATPLAYAGMPAPRWWELEEHETYLGDLGTGPDDLARSVIAAYGAVAGDDWFVVPCRIPSGSLTQVVELRVRDDFNQWTSVGATAVDDARRLAGTGRRRVWSWFELANDPGPDAGLAPLLFLPPVIAAVQQGPLLEEVEFRRDQVANMAWAIERKIESGAGRPVYRDRGPAPPHLEPLPPGHWRYQLATDVPDNWVPLVPVRIEGGARPEIALRRARMASTATSDANRALGTILEPDQPFVLAEEEIPDGGMRVTRRFQQARSADGRTHLWIGRRKRPSSGPMRRTPLRTDELTGWEPPRA